MMLKKALLSVILISTCAVAETRVIAIKIAKDVKNREPIGVAEVFPNTVKKLYCWTKVITTNPPTFILHEWCYNGKKMASVKLDIKYSTFRTWSSKRILPNWTGKWKCVVKDENGKEIAQKGFTIKKSDNF